MTPNYRHISPMNPPIGPKGSTPPGDKEDRPQDDLTKPYYSIKEAAALIDMSKRHVERLIDVGEFRNCLDNALPGTTKQQLRIPRETIRRYREKRKCP